MSFLKTLFDLSFERFLVIKIVRALYCVALVLTALLFAAMVAGGVIGLLQAQAELTAVFSGDGMFVSLRNIEAKRTAAIVSLVAAPFAAALGIVGSRIGAEFTIVVFSIADSLKRPAEPRDA